MLSALAYHDVVDEGKEDATGFPGAGAARYKLTPAEFREHIRAIVRVIPAPPIAVPQLLLQPQAPSGLLLTFDDGGASSYSPIADILEEHGWRGYFFITADYIDSDTFVTTKQIQELRSRGHLIGSHSSSHPKRMWSCSWNELVREWQTSSEVLTQILGEPITLASVPGGFYSRVVAEAAAQAGIKVLFNSEPTARPHTVNGCLVLGRYTVYRGMSAKAAAALASGRGISRLRQTLFWNMKKIAKVVGGPAYVYLRKRLLTLAYSVNGKVR